jgi:integrase
MGQVLKLLLLTGCRRTELAGMRRGDDGTFVIPSSRTKNKRPHVVPLPALARGIIASVKLVEGPEGYVFTISDKSPVGGWSMSKNRLDAAMGNPPAGRLHDLRRTFVTGLADLGIRPDVTRWEPPLGTARRHRRRLQ